MTTTLPGDAVPEVRTSRASLPRRLVRNPVGIVSLGFVVLIVLAGIFAPVLAPRDPSLADPNALSAGPGGEYLLGTDGSGRDVLSRLLYGIRPTVEGAVLTVVLAAAIGTSAGLVAGYYRRGWEAGFDWFFGLFMALPGLVVLLAARAVIGPSMYAAMTIFGVLMSPVFYRVVVSAVSAVRNELYVDAARVSGLTDRRIIARHILVVVRAPAVVLAANLAGIALAISAGLDFLGLGDISKPTWGGMLGEAFGNIYTAPLQLLWPSLAIGTTMIALALLGNALRDELQGAGRTPRRRGPEPVRHMTEQAEPTVVHDEAAEARGEELLDVGGLTVGFDQPDGSFRTVVDGVSLTVRRGEVHGLIGESGSGKTLTAFAVMRLLPSGARQVGGDVRLQGTDLGALPEKEMARLRGAKIAYVPQEPMSNLDPAFTIGAQLAEPMRRHLGMTKAQARARALELLGRVGIEDPRRTFDAHPHQVSGGMAQRVLIAGAVSCGPDLLIADEPTTALDVTVQAEVLDLLRDLQAELDMGVLLVTHNLGVVADLCDRVSVMHAGRVVESGPVDAIFAHARHPHTQSLFTAVVDGGEPRGPLVEAEHA